MSRIQKLELDVPDALFLVVFERVKKLQGAFKVVQRIKKIFFTALAAVVLHDAMSIFKHKSGEVPRWSSCVNDASESFFVELRNAPDMVNVGMGYDKRVNFGRFERERFFVFFIGQFVALKKPAVNEYFFAFSLKQITGTGYFLSPAIKRNCRFLRHRLIIYSRQAVCQY